MKVRCPVCKSPLQYSKINNEDIIYCPKDKNHRVAAALKNKTVTIPYIHN